MLRRTSQKCDFWENSKNFSRNFFEILARILIGWRHHGLFSKFSTCEFNHIFIYFRNWVIFGSLSRIKIFMEIPKFSVTHGGTFWNNPVHQSLSRPQSGVFRNLFRYFPFSPFHSYRVIFCSSLSDSSSKSLFW